MKKYLGSLLIFSIVNVSFAESIRCESETSEEVAVDGVDAVSSKKVLLRTYQDEGREVKVESNVKLVSIYSPAAVKSHRLALVVENPDKQIEGAEGARPSITCDLPGVHTDVGTLVDAKIGYLGRSQAKQLIVKIKQIVNPDVNNSDRYTQEVQVTVQMGAEGVFGDAANTLVLSSTKVPDEEVGQ